MVKKKLLQRFLAAIEACDLVEVDAVMQSCKQPKKLLARVNDKKRTALHVASLQANGLSIISMLRECGGDLQALDSKGWTPLHCAAGEGHLDICEFLLVAGGGAGVKDGHGSTPLHLLAQHVPGEKDKEKYQSVLYTCAECPSNLTAPNDRNETPLHLAAQSRNCVCVQFLVAYDVDIDALTKSGESALHYAVRSGDTGVVSLLLELGANPNTSGDEGTPLALATAANLPEVIDILEGASTVGGVGDQHRKKLLRILRHPQMCFVYLDFLERRHSEENLALWIAIEKYRGMLFDEWSSMGKYILEEYVLPLAPFQVNLDSHLVKDVTEADDYHEDTFDEIQNQVLALMAADLYPKFLQSSNYKEYIDGKAADAPHERSRVRSALEKYFGARNSVAQPYHQPVIVVYDPDE